jgi:protoheme IX farnesyltransferase
MSDVTSFLASRWRIVSDFVELTKPNVTVLILLSTAVGFYLGSLRGVEILLLLHTLIGTTLVASGTAALNEYWERDVDARMSRTSRRPLPAGRMQPWKALSFALALSAFGVLYLARYTNWGASLLSLLTLTSYVLLYTPLKTRTPHCTSIGAIPGAIPPLLGWVAARGSITPAACVLFLIVYIWQFPHFLSIAWLYRQDYARGGIRMLPVVEPNGESTARQIVASLAVLLPISLLPTLLGATGTLYMVGSFLLGLGFLYFGLQAAHVRTMPRFRRLLRASVIYLPLVYALMVVDKARTAF